MGLPALRDLLAREEKILSNRRLCQSLPDKGQKVKMKKEEIEVKLCKPVVEHFRICRSDSGVLTEAHRREEPVDR